MMYARFTLLQAVTSLALIASAGSAAAAQVGTVKEGSTEQASVSQSGYTVPAEPSAQSTSKQNTHCVIRLEPVAEGQKESASKHIGCFSTLAEATYAGTNGAVSLSPDVTPESLKESDLAASASTLIGVDYQYSYYRGKYLYWYAGNSYGCYGGYWYRANMPSYFNNILSSTKTYGWCRYNTNYERYYWHGRYATCYGSCVYIGEYMDNRTSSKTWR